MTEYITPFRIANAICQDTTFKGTYVLVEGNNDYTLFRKFFRHEISEVQIAFGKQNIIEAIAEINSRGFKNTIGIIDADFYNLESTTTTFANIFFTDNHDVESTIFQSNALDAIVDQHCVKEKVQSFKNENNSDDLRNIILEQIKPLGYFKWANHKNNWGFTFKPTDNNHSVLKIEEFIPVNTIKFTGYDSIVRTVYNYSRNKSKELPLQSSTIVSIKNLSETEVDNYQLCNGHDISYVFALALRKKIASYNSKGVSADQIEKELILAYDSRSFSQTELYLMIKEWENAENKSLLKF